MRITDGQPNNKTLGIVVWLCHTETDVVVVCNYCKSQTMASASIRRVYRTCDFVHQYFGEL